MDYRAKAEQLLEEFYLCLQSKPRHNAIDIQLEKDAVAKWATALTYNLRWGSATDISEACEQLDVRLQKLKEKVVFEILKNGSI